MCMRSECKRVNFSIIVHLASCFEKGGWFRWGESRCAKEQNSSCFGLRVARVMQKDSWTITFLRYHIQMGVMNLKNQIFDLGFFSNPSKLRLNLITGLHHYIYRKYDFYIMISFVLYSYFLTWIQLHREVQSLEHLLPIHKWLCFL